MDINQSFAGDWLKAESFEAEMCLTIKHVSKEKVGEDEKPVVSFLETTQGLVLNKTNASAIVMLYGRETNNWTGKQLILYPTFVDYAGKQVRAIRVRAPGNSSPAPARPASSPPPPPRRQSAPASPPPPPEPKFWLDEGGADPQLHTLAQIREKVNGGAEGLFWCPENGKEYHPVDQVFLVGGDPFPG